MILKELLALFLLLACTYTFKMAPLSQEGLGTTPATKGAEVRPGRGYSSDRQQVSSIDCFKVNTAPYSPIQSNVRLNSGANFSEIEQLLGLNFSSKAGIDSLNVEGEAGFLKEIRDTEMSMSINYFYLAQSEAAMETGYGPAGALTYDGLRAYGPQSNPDPHFGLVCGDKFIRSFKLGAKLMLSVKLHFGNPYDRYYALSYFQSGFAGFLDIYGDIQSISSGYNIDGVVEILVYQSGGKPAELVKIMDSINCTSSYCAAACNMRYMDDCLGSINSLYDYALTNFPSQFSLEDPNTLSPLSIGLIELQDVKQLGLSMPPSYVTQEVVTMRERIGIQLFNNEYIAARIYVMNHIFPFDKDSRLWESLAQLSDLSSQNTALIMDQNSGGILCFKEPQNCQANGANLLTTLKPIDQLVTSVNQSIKYKITNNLCDADFYRISDTQYFSPKYNQRKCRYFYAYYYHVVNQVLSYELSLALTQGTSYYVTGFDMTQINFAMIHAYDGLRRVVTRSSTYTQRVQEPIKSSQYAFYLTSL